MEEELIRRAEDLRNRCERASVLTATAYLTPAEQAGANRMERPRRDRIA